MPVISTQTTVTVTAWDTATNAPKTGDAANIALRRVADGTAGTIAGAVAEVDATNQPGVYKITLASGENNGYQMSVAGKSSTAGVQIFGAQWTNIDSIADTVLDAVQADHEDAGSIGKSIHDAGAAGDPWSTALPGSYPTGTAGNRIGTLIDKALSTVGGTITLTAASNQITVDASGEGIGGTGNITVVRGTSPTIAFTATGKTLTGHSLYCTCRANRNDLTDTSDATALFSKACTVTAPTAFSLALTPTQTDLLAVGTDYWYEIRDVTAGDSLLIARLAVSGSVVKRTS